MLAFGGVQSAFGDMVIGPQSVDPEVRRQATEKAQQQMVAPTAVSRAPRSAAAGIDG
jgi:hypothetical protein